MFYIPQIELKNPVENPFDTAPVNMQMATKRFRMKKV